MAVEFGGQYQKSKKRNATEIDKDERQRAE